MRNQRALAALALAAGALLLAYGFLEGQARIGLFVVVPFLVATGLAPAIGIVLLLAGVVTWVLGRPGRPASAEDATTRAAGVAMIGPIPVAWRGDPGLLKWTIGVGVVLGLAILLLSWAMR